MDYRHLSAFVERMLPVSDVVDTVNMDHIQQGDCSIKSLNPNRIVPIGPKLPFDDRLDRRRSPV